MTATMQQRHSLVLQVRLVKVLCKMYRGLWSRPLASLLLFSFLFVCYGSARDSVQRALAEVAMGQMADASGSIRIPEGPRDER